MTQSDGETKTIDGYSYTVRYLDPSKAVSMLTYLSKVMAPVLGVLANKALSNGNLINVKEKESEHIDYDGVEVGIKELFDRIDDSQLQAIINELASVTQVNLSEEKAPQLKSIFTVHFRGRIGSLYKWLAFALRVQFADFFSDITSVINLSGLKQGHIQ